MDDEKFSEIDDLLGLTDTEASSTTSSDQDEVYDNRQSFVLELHELRKDDPNPTDDAPDAKNKRHKKKKKRPQSKKSHVSGSSDSISEVSSIVSIPAEDAREEFYDAHESYHDLPVVPVTGTALTLAISQHGQDLKQNQRSSSPTVATTDNRTQPSALTKPSRKSG